MKTLPLATMLDRFRTAFTHTTGRSLKRCELLEILAATLGFHNSNELTSAAAENRLDIPKAQSGFNRDLITIIDPRTHEAFGLTYERLENARTRREMSVICTPSGALVDISDILKAGATAEDALRRPSAMDLSMADPKCDKRHPVNATISDDNSVHEIMLDVSAFLAEQTDDTLLTMAKDEWRFSSTTDTVAYWSVIEEADDLKQMWDYMSAAGKTTRDGIGFAVVIDEPGAEKWMRFHRPEAYASLMAEREEPIIFTDSRGCEIDALDAQSILRNALEYLPEHDQKAIEALILKTPASALHWMPDGTETEDSQQHAKNQDAQKIMSSLCEKIKTLAEKTPAETISGIADAEARDRLTILNDMLHSMQAVSWPDLGQHPANQQDDTPETAKNT